MLSMPSLASQRLLDLSAPPGSDDTIHVDSSFTVGAGDVLNLRGDPGFKLEARNGAPVELDMEGTVSVDGGGRHVRVVGIATSISLHGEADVTIGADGSLTVTGGADATFVAGAYLQTGTASFDNHGQVHVVSAGAGVAAGIAAESPGDVTIANSGEVEVGSAGSSYGLYAESTGGGLTNAGSVVVSGTEALGMLLLTATGGLVNTGEIEANAVTADALAVGAAVVDGGLVNTGRIHVTSEGNAIGLEGEGITGLVNTGAVIAGTSSLTAPSAGLAIDMAGGGIVHNSGLVRADYSVISLDVLSKAFGGGGPASNDILINDGKLIGDIALGGGSDGVSSTGRIVGDVDLGDDGDIYIGNRCHLEGMVLGGLGNDNIETGSAADLVYGDEQDDSLGGGDDVLRGMKGDDSLFGGQGADTLIGGQGADSLTGGAGDDVFKFTKLGDSTAGSADLIADLGATDQIDLHLIDADTGTDGDQAFHLVGAFSHATGELVVSYDAGTGLTTLSGDVDGDGTADLVITAAGDQSGFTNFVL